MTIPGVTMPPAPSSARSARQLVAGTISTDALAAGDVLDTEVDAISGGGTMGKGVFGYVDPEED